MTNKHLFLAATMGAALVSCSDELTDTSANGLTATNGSSAIVFSNAANQMTRSGGAGTTTGTNSHATSAALLGNQLYFYGAKSDGSTYSPIFDNYVLKYTANSAGSTDTNVADWEYAGYTSKKGASQDTKYWNYSAQSYQFVAVKGLTDVAYINNTTDGYKVSVASADAMDTIYIADRVTATPTAQAATASSPATVAYNSTVTFNFRRMGARMRIGFYETVPGYAIKNLIFYYVGAESGSKTLGVGGAFPTSGKYNVTYDDATNAATVKFNGGSNTMAWANTFGTLDYTSVSAEKQGDASKYTGADGKMSDAAVNVFLGSDAAHATYAKGSYTIDGKEKVTSDYKPILPNENNSLKMQLRVDYTLVALDGSGDVINVRDAYVSVPVEYLQWKPNYAYTYLFKISDKSNGYTGTGGGGEVDTETGGRKPNAETGGDSNPEDGKQPYIPDPNATDKDGNKIPTTIPDPDHPGQTIPNPDCPLVPNPAYGEGPKGDQHDPSNPVPTPQIKNPDSGEGKPDSIPDPSNPAGLFPITFDAMVVETEENTQQTVTTVATPSITATQEGQSITTNNEFKKAAAITLSVQDGATPVAYDYISAGTTVLTEKDAEKKYASSTTWSSLTLTSNKATFTPSAAGYYVIRVNVGTTDAPVYGYKVLKVVE